MSLRDRVRSGWNAFMNKDPTYNSYEGAYTSYSYRPDRIRLTRGNEKSIITAVYNRIAIDCASHRIEHVQLDQNNRYIETKETELNECLTVSANIDQTGRTMIQDFVMSILDEGVAACVPVDTTIDPNDTEAYDINTLRVGKITQWMPRHVKVRLYNERSGKQQEILISKEIVSIVENPFYAIMNESNSTAQRLMRKLTLLDIVDEQKGSNKLDMIIQMPYVIKTPAQKANAEQRRKDIEMQLSNSKFGIAYTDGTEHIVQLNRSIDNQLLTQIEKLQTTLYSQLGITEEIMNGTADENTMNNYYNRTIEPIMSAITDEMYRKFLSKAARTRLQSIKFFKDPFKLIPTSQIAEMADKMTRNEIMTSNEMRQAIGMKPSFDPRADQLRNSNISEAKDVVQYDVNGNPITNGYEEVPGEEQQ